MKTIDVLFQEVKNELTKRCIDWEEGTEHGFEKHSLIFDGGDCKILVYVVEEKGEMGLAYSDLFLEGDYNIIFEEDNDETTTSYRGDSKNVEDMLKDIFG